MGLRIDLEAKVRTREGEAAGTRARAIFDPEATRVQAFVVDTGGLPDRPVLVPAPEVAAAAHDGDVLRLCLGEAELDRLPTSVAKRYAAPTGGGPAPGPRPSLGSVPVAAGHHSPQVDTQRRPTPRQRPCRLSGGRSCGQTSGT
jgi:hypothetical protein